ncbi:MAG: POTRA domain-containing protein [Bacteroidota bacterium]
MKKILLLGFVLLTLVAENELNAQANRVSYGNPREYEIAEINVEGSKFLDEIALISLSGLKVGDKVKVPGEEISGAIRKLWKQGIIGNVEIFASKIEGPQIWLTIRLTERPRLTRFIFEGVNKTQAGELDDKVNLVKGKVLTDAIVKNAETTVKKYFVAKGFLNADIEVFQQEDTLLRNSVQLKIVVDRGRKVKIKDISFEGDSNFYASKLRKQLKGTGEIPKLKIHKKILEKSLSLLNPVNAYEFISESHKVDKAELKEYLSDNANINFFKANKFVESDFEDDKNSLIGFYNSKGYRDAEIISDTVYSDGDRFLNIDIKVDPGKKYYFRNILWTGNYIHSDQTLDQVLGITKGDTYDLDLVNKKLNFNPTGADVSALYMDNGYLFFRVDPVEVGVEGDSVDLEMRITEGAQATIDKVYVTGNDRTNDHVILRELRTLPGDKFSRAQLIRTQRELSQLGYFDPEKVNPVPLPNPLKETVDIEWQVEERPSDQVQLSGGWGGFFGFVGTVGLQFNNFSLRNIPNFKKWRPLPIGDGQKLNLSIQANGRRFQSYNFGFSEPWLGGRKPNSFGVNFNFSVQRSLNTRNETIGSLKVSGVTVSLGRRVSWPDDFFTVSNSVAVLQYRLFNFGQTLGFSTGDANSITFNTTIARNSVDQPMFPRQGSQVSINVALTPPYSLWRNINYDDPDLDNATRYQWLEYHKWNLDFKYYLRLVGNLVLAPRAHFGFIGSYSSRAGIGPFERFQLGGDGLTGQNFLLGTDIIGLRGYENNSIVPIDTEQNIEGGVVFNKFVMELRYLISPNPAATIYALGFAEAGNNWNNYRDFNPYDQFRSAGVGVRIFMPAFGLLGLDWGYGFDSDANFGIQRGSQFHFSIGQQIR